MNKKISLLLPTLLFLFSFSTFAQNTYSYGFNFDVKGYDVLPITNFCTSANPTTEECVAVGTIHKSFGNDDKNNGIHFVHFDNNGNLFTSVYINHPNADERVVKILKLDSLNCKFLIVSLIREYVSNLKDAIKLTTIDINGKVFNESIVSVNSTNNFAHLYPMDAVIKDTTLYVVGGADSSIYKSSVSVDSGLNFAHKTYSFVAKLSVHNYYNSQILFFNNNPTVNYTYMYFLVKNSNYNFVKSIKVADSGRIFLLGAANSLVDYPLTSVFNYCIPNAMIAELDTTSYLHLKSFRVFNNEHMMHTGSLATDLYYDNNSNCVNLLTNEVSVYHHISPYTISNQSILPCYAYSIYKLNKFNLANIGVNKFQPFDNLFATNFIKQSTGDIKIVGWQNTSDLSNTTPYTIYRDCPFIQSITIDNSLINFANPISLNTLVDGTLNLTTSYQYLGGLNLSSIWLLPRVGSLSGLNDNLVLTGTHLLNGSTYGFKTIFTDFNGNSCNEPEMYYNKNYIVLDTISSDTKYESLLLPTLIYSTHSLDSQYALNLKNNCNVEKIFKKTNSNGVLVQNLSIYPTRVAVGETVNITSIDNLKESTPIEINIVNEIGSKIYYKTDNFNGAFSFNPNIAQAGIYFIEVKYEGKKYREKLFFY